MGKTRPRVLAPDTDMSTLVFENPADLDTRHLAITSIDSFDTMGLSDHSVDTASWRLRIGGAVSAPMDLSYASLRALPVVERGVLLICPGVFAYYGRWSGVSIAGLLRQAGLNPRATFVDLKGPSGPYEKVERFRIGDIQSNRVFLAYAVNGQTLPRRHGYPLRTVAEGRLGSEWVKYVTTVEAVIAPLKEETKRTRPLRQPAFLP
jgi:sulfoxide reductase catalytic subunit YedY